MPMLEAMPNEQTGHKPAPEQWSPGEIIGHLIDSASNNHQRFVRAQFQDNLVFSGYDQNAWVVQQNYQTADWSALITLWHSFNTHLVHVIQNIPVQEATRKRHPHNLHELAWNTVPAKEPVTLAYFMDDYIGHLKHHLNQIFPTTF
jgi:hypothetical protein